MSEHKTLLQFLLDLLHDKSALADFREDPQQSLHAAGLDHVCVQDIQDLLPVVLEKADPEKCAKYEDDCDKGDCHDDAPKHHDPHHHNGHHWNDDPGHDDHKWHDHDSEIDKVVTHLNYVTNNYSFDSHDTVFNTTNVTKIWADHGAKVDVTNQTQNASDGGVNVGHDNNAPIATGGHNQIGDGNMQSGDGSTTAFGAGSALSHVGANDGGALSVNGPATGNSEHANFQNYGDGNLTAATHAPASSSTVDSHNHTSTDSHNLTKTSTDSHDNTNSNNHDSGNTDTDTNTHTETNTDLSQHNDNSVDNSIHAHHATVDAGDHLFPVG
ncbi:IniB N-terminal domain-containing protein [Actinomycetospora endophytica]|uniref:IniB N-terminal domain-containing protein n=1 Tax=Actinomycetospora endophytica TaxID=2291215 RepID=A0ABS8PKB7_9PSEU|nr:IniB N-terminal domain-containing protein [Actinomycetospora endophytica]MCD2197861.1 IniB N-terminal domain-containing protein [Actinomycetospora endophytica]